MKKYYPFLFVIFIATQSHAKFQKSACTISMKPEWTSLDASDHAYKFGGKWILAGKTIFKKRTKDPIGLKKMTLSWHGLHKIKKLTASLYRQMPNQKFIPIEENLLSDGHWNNKKQILQFTFDHKEYLNSHSIFCLVLTVPENIDPILKKGSFKLITKNLPPELQTPDKERDLQISFLTASNKTSRKKRRLNNSLIC